MSNVFLLSWDYLGVETVLNVTDYEKAVVWARLGDQDPPVNLNSMLNHLFLRARANPQRNYEIYTVHVAEGVSEEDVREMFHNDPQGSADLIRESGNKIYSDRINNKERLIV